MTSVQLPFLTRLALASAKLARQAQSKEKVLAKMVAGGLTEKVVQDQGIDFHFGECGKVRPRVPGAGRIWAVWAVWLFFDCINIGWDLCLGCVWQLTPY
jgi:hypothetical protein